MIIQKTKGSDVKYCFRFINEIGGVYINDRIVDLHIYIKNSLNIICEEL